MSHMPTTIDDEDLASFEQLSADLAAETAARIAADAAEAATRAAADSALDVRVDALEAAGASGNAEEVQEDLDAYKIATDAALASIDARIDVLEAESEAAGALTLVTEFGATGDGTTDDRVAIQTAIDYCKANGIKRLHFPRGTYRVSRLLTGGVGLGIEFNLNNGLICSGDGPGVSTIKMITDFSQGFRLVRIVDCTDIVFQDMTLDGMWAGESGSEQIHLTEIVATTTTTRGVYFRNVHFNNCRGDGFRTLGASATNMSVDPATDVFTVWKTQNEVFTTVNTTTNLATITAHGVLAGAGPVQITTTGTLPAGLSLATNYYLAIPDANSIGFCTTYADAVAGTNLVDITDAGTGTHTIGSVIQPTNHGFNTGYGPFKITVANETTLPGGLARETDYYFIKVSNSTFKLATSYANAIAGTPVVDVTSAGTDRSFGLALYVEEAHAIDCKMVNVKRAPVSIQRASSGCSVQQSYLENVSDQVIDFEASGASPRRWTIAFNTIVSRSPSANNACTLYGAEQPYTESLVFAFNRVIDGCVDIKRCPGIKVVGNDIRARANGVGTSPVLRLALSKDAKVYGNTLTRPTGAGAGFVLSITTDESIGLDGCVVTDNDINQYTESNIIDFRSAKNVTCKGNTVRYFGASTNTYRAFNLLSTVPAYPTGNIEIAGNNVVGDAGGGTLAYGAYATVATDGTVGKISVIGNKGTGLVVGASFGGLAGSNGYTANPTVRDNTWVCSSSLYTGSFNVAPGLEAVIVSESGKRTTFESTGSPEGVVTGNAGDSFHSTSGSAPFEYVKTTTGGKTGWSALPSSISAATVADGSITNAKLADMAPATFKGRQAGSTGVPEDMSATQATALLDAFSSSLKGLAPASGGGTSNFLRADGTWTVPVAGAAAGTSGQTRQRLAMVTYMTPNLAGDETDQWWRVTQKAASVYLTIINPTSGPGRTANYIIGGATQVAMSTQMGLTQAKGINVVGYMTTNYRDIVAGNEVQAERTFTVNTGTDVLTLSASRGWTTGMGPIQVRSSTTLPAGLALSTDYYWIEVSSTTGKLATSYANAMAGTAIDITTTGTGTHSIGMSRTLANIQNVYDEIDLYFSYYPTINGIFFDEVRVTDSTDLTYYTNLYNYVKGKSASAIVVMNPGTTSSYMETMIDCADIWMSYENTAANYLARSISSSNSWERFYPPTKFWHCLRQVPYHLINELLAMSARRNAGYVSLIPSDSYGDIGLTFEAVAEKMALGPGPGAEAQIEWTSESATTTSTTSTKALGTTTLDGRPNQTAGVSFTMPSSNRLTYGGSVTRNFRVSFHGDAVAAASASLTLKFKKNGSTVSTNGTSDAFAIDTSAVPVYHYCDVQLATGDYLELFLETAASASVTVKNGSVMMVEVV